MFIHIGTSHTFRKMLSVSCLQSLYGNLCWIILHEHYVNGYGWFLIIFLKKKKSPSVM